MKILIFSGDDELKKFAKASGRDVTNYVNFIALKDFVTNMNDNLGPDGRVALLFDYDEEKNRELIDEYNKLMTDNQRVFRIYVSGSVALKEIKEHQAGANSGQAYMFKPLSLEDILETIEDLDAANPYDPAAPIIDDVFDDDDVTKMDMNFRNMILEGEDETAADIPAIDLGERDSTEVRSLVGSHNLESTALESKVNQKIQESFDDVFSKGVIDDESVDGLSFSLDEKLDDDNSEDASAIEFSAVEDNGADVIARIELGDEIESLEALEPLDAIDASSDEDSLSLSLGDEDDLTIDSSDEPISSTDEEMTEDGHEGFDEGSIEFHDKSATKHSMPTLVFDIAEATQETIDQVGLGESEQTVGEHTATHIQDKKTPVAQEQVVEEKESVLNFLAPKSKLLDSDDFKPSMNEPDAIRFQATIRQLREEREGLLTIINKHKQDALLVEQDNLGFKAELDETKIELTIMKKRFANEVDDLKYRLGLADEKKMMAEEKAHHLEQEFGRLESKVRINIGQVQQREKELEGQLELIKMDSESQVQTRDKKILELKRKIDQLEFNMQNTMIREQKSRQDKVVLEDRLDKIMRTLRGSIEVLEEDMSWKSRTARDQFDKGDQ